MGKEGVLDEYTSEKKRERKLKTTDPRSWQNPHPQRRALRRAHCSSRPPYMTKDYEERRRQSVQLAAPWTYDFFL